MAVFWFVALSFTTTVALMIEAASTSETSVNFCQTTQRNKPEKSHLHTHCRETLKSQDLNEIFDIHTTATSMFAEKLDDF
jgi:hypothetical protein